MIYSFLIDSKTQSPVTIDMNDLGIGDGVVIVIFRDPRRLRVFTGVASKNVGKQLIPVNIDAQSREDLDRQLGKIPIPNATYLLESDLSDEVFEVLVEAMR